MLWSEEEEQGLSFVNGFVENFIRGMTDDQKKELLRTAQEQVLATTSPEQRLALARDAVQGLIGSLSLDQRASLAREIMSELQRS